MLELVYGIGSNRVQLCSTPAMPISGQDVPEMIRAWRGNLATLHLNDNYGLIRPVFEDLHLFPGYGTLEWKPIFDALRDIRFRGVLNIEPVVELARMPRAVRVIQLRPQPRRCRCLQSYNYSIPQTGAEEKRFAQRGRGEWRKIRIRRVRCILHRRSLCCGSG